MSSACGHVHRDSRSRSVQLNAHHLRGGDGAGGRGCRVIAVLDAAGVGTAALVGYSAGARIAYAVVRAYPGRISAAAGIGAVGAPGDDASDGAETAARVRAAMEEIAAEEPEPLRAGCWTIWPVPRRRCSP
jgi:pimeloyl-ACP methyl ester carboxylesterase